MMRRGAVRRRGSEVKCGLRHEVAGHASHVFVVHNVWVFVLDWDWDWIAWVGYLWDHVDACWGQAALHCTHL